MNNKHQELVAEKVAQLGDLWRLIETKETTDSGCPKFERVNREVAQTLQDVIDTVLEEEREELKQNLHEQIKRTFNGYGGVHGLTEFDLHDFVDNASTK